VQEGQALSLIGPIVDQGGGPGDRLLLGRALLLHGEVLTLLHGGGVEDAYRKAAVVLKSLLAEEPENEEYRAEAVKIGIALADFLLIRESIDPAQEVLRETQPPYWTTRSRNAAPRNAPERNWAKCSNDGSRAPGDPPTMRIELARHLVRLRANLSNDAPGVSYRQEDLARACLILGKQLLAYNLDRAESYCKSAADQYERLSAAQPKRVVLRSYQAEALARTGRGPVSPEQVERGGGDDRSRHRAAKGSANQPAGRRNRSLPLREHLTLHARIQLKQGRHEDAARVAEERLALDAELAATCRAVAGLLADCSRVAGLDARLSETDRKQKAKEYADRAMQILDQAVKKGYKDVADLEKAPALEPLRTRDDFKALLQKLREK